MTLTKAEEMAHWLHNMGSGQPKFQDYVILPKTKVHNVGTEIKRLNKLVRDLAYVVLDGKYKSDKAVREAAKEALEKL